MSEDRATEQILEAARHLDKLSVADVLRLIHREDLRAHEAVGRVLPQLEEAVDVLVTVLAGGGRWFNVGAGTSGRIGVLDASEIPPTFGMPAKAVQGIMAGGDRALRTAVEDAEDNAEAGAWELREAGLEMGDAVVAISASGSTPFAMGALEAAYEVGARRIAVTCNAGADLAELAEIAIIPEVGPEVVAGSTRMKGGLAQKMVLHSLSTTVMVRLGRVEGNLMTHVVPGSAKLRERSVRIVMALTDLSESKASVLLHDCDGSVHAAVVRARSGSGGSP